MQQIISFSGGRTSAFMTLEVLKIHPDAEVIYMDTGAEHPKTYEFIRNFSKEFNINITCLRVIPNPEMRKASTYELLTVEEIKPDLEPWKRVLQKYGHPYVGGAFCTDRMKTVPFTKYCDEKYGKNNYHRWIGIRIDEQKRLTNKREGFHYLADISDFEKQDILDWWSEQSFDLGIQEHLGNCVFCIKKSLPKVALAAKDEPELAQEFIQLLDDNDVKNDKIMYRSNKSLSEVIAIFGDTDRTELASRMRSMRQYDTGSCSESCEAFADESEEVSVNVGNDGAIMEYMNRDFYALKLEGGFYLSEIRKDGAAKVGKFDSIENSKKAVVDYCNKVEKKEIETPYDYLMEDERIKSVGGGVLITELNGRYYMGTCIEEYSEDLWSWEEIDKNIYDVMKTKEH